MDERKNNIDSALQLGEAIVARYSSYILTNKRLLRFSFLSGRFRDRTLLEMEIQQVNRGNGAILLFAAFVAVYAVSLLIDWQSGAWGFSFILNTTLIGFLAVSCLYLWLISRRMCYSIQATGKEEEWILRTYGIAEGRAFVERVIDAVGATVHMIPASP